MNAILTLLLIVVVLLVVLLYFVVQMYLLRKPSALLKADFDFSAEPKIGQVSSILTGQLLRRNTRLSERVTALEARVCGEIIESSKKATVEKPLIQRMVEMKDSMLFLENELSLQKQLIYNLTKEVRDLKLKA